MSEPDPADWVTIIHPETGGTGEVHRDSLPAHYASGWRLLAAGEMPPAEPSPEPEPMTKAQVTRAASAETKEN
jgi:uncharacterized protein YciI